LAVFNKLAIVRPTEYQQGLDNFDKQIIIVFVPCT